MDHEDHRMPRRFGQAEPTMRGHDRLRSDGAGGKQPIGRLRAGDAPHSHRKAFVRRLGQARHHADKAPCPPNIPEICTTKICFCPESRLFQTLNLCCQQPIYLSNIGLTPWLINGIEKCG